MKIKIDLRKSLEENASFYFEKAKKARKKLEGVKKTIQEFKEKQLKEEGKHSEFTSNITKISDKKKFWFEKFRWFISSEGFLVIGAKDSTTNEIIIKKHLEEGDLVFHTDMAGSPFVVIKKNSQEDVDKLFGKSYVEQPEMIGEISISEAANFTFAHSKAWKQGLSSAAVFWVLPEQVSKEANAGESLSKGSFVIRGKTNYVDVINEFAIGLWSSKIVDLEDEKTNDKVEENTIGSSEEKNSKNKFVLLAGPPSAIKKYVKTPLLIQQGKDKPSEVARQIRQKIRKEFEVDLDMDLVIRQLPQGIQLKKERRRK